MGRLLFAVSITAAVLAAPAFGTKAPAFFHVIASSPTWSPAGDAIAYSQLGPGYSDHPELVLASFADGTRRVVAPDAWAPQWSPTENRIAFLTYQPGVGNVSQLRVADAAVRGGGFWLIANDVANFAWDVRGDEIFYDNAGLTCHDIRAVDTHDFSKRRNVVTGARPVPSPDGKRIAFLMSPGTCTGGLGSVAVANIDGSNEHVVFENLATSVAWSPDGKQLAVETAESIRPPIVVMDADGSNQRIIAFGTHPAWSPDGRTIAYLSVPVLSAAFPHDEPYLEMVDVATLANRPRLTTASAERAGGPAWSPDGSVVALSRALERGGHSEGIASGLNRFVSLYSVPVDEPANAHRLSIAPCELLSPKCTRAGGPGGNVLGGTSDRDVIWGYGGDDRINGHAGNDDLHGGSGNDELTGGAGRDTLSAGSGNDVVLARDHARDVVYCGAGYDTVVSDRFDTVARDCERVVRTR